MKNENDRTLSRRTLLKFGLGASGAVAVLGGSLRWLFWESIKSVYLTVAYPALNSGPRGRLDAATLRTLEATVETLLEIPSRPHYRRFFEWHATHVEGYRSMYQDLARYVERQAERLNKSQFADCTFDQRRTILSEIMDYRTDPLLGTDLSRFWRGLIKRRLVQFDKFVLQEILDLYGHSDAWLEIGYEAFPTTPTGLEAYRLPPASV